MSKNNSTTLLPWLGIALLIIVADQITKTMIIGTLQLGDSHTITSFFNIEIGRAHV